MKRAPKNSRRTSLRAKSDKNMFIFSAQYCSLQMGLGACFGWRSPGSTRGDDAYSMTAARYFSFERDDRTLAPIAAAAATAPVDCVCPFCGRLDLYAGGKTASPFLFEAITRHSLFLCADYCTLEAIFLFLSCAMVHRLPG